MNCRPLQVLLISLACCLSAEAKFSFKPTTPKAPRPTQAPAPEPAQSPSARETPAQAPSRSEAKESAKYDRRVKAALDAESLRYQVNASGNFVLSCSWETGDSSERSQLVYIQSGTETLGGFEIREIWSKGFGGGKLPRSELAKLLVQNESLKIGAWGIQQSAEGEEHLLFTAKVPANLSSSTIRSIVFNVAKVADALELKLDGGDDL